ncbi:MAG TPA: hypothetical protein VGO25_09245 [Rhodanobacteraceae bacterium]|jgi:uncharacterized membrane protein|nr:hypothetical protein [Rhodanobacteraceae bacterium]
MRTSLCASLVLALLAGNATAATFTVVGGPGAQLTSLSHNGRIAGGINGSSAWRWNKDIGIDPMTGFLSTNGMDSWGQPVAGAYSPDNDVADAVAALYYSNSDLVGGPVVIGGYPNTGGGTGQGISEAYGVSDNAIAVGLAYDETNNPIAFRWTADEGMTRLPVNRPDKFSRANGISRDGSTIYGWNDQEDGYRSGVIWQNGQAIDLTDTDGNPIGEALAASADGSVVVGAGYGTINGNEAWRWTAATGPQPIGVLSSQPASPNKNKQIRQNSLSQLALHSERRDVRREANTDGFFFPQAYGFAVSDDGKIVVGASGAFGREATIWTQVTGMQYLSTYAAAHGVTIPTGWDLNTALALSADGLSIGGWALGPSNVGAFIMDVRPDRTYDARVVAHGTVDGNNLQSGPFAGVPVGTPVSMVFRLSQDGTELEPGEDTAYPILVPTFKITAGSATGTLAASPNAVVELTNDFPLSDGIHLFGTPLASGEGLSFELFNPGGDMFDSDDLSRINRTFGPEFFEKIAWSVSQGFRSMDIVLDSVTISDFKPAATSH